MQRRQDDYQPLVSVPHSNPADFELDDNIKHRELAVEEHAGVEVKIRHQTILYGLVRACGVRVDHNLGGGAGGLAAHRLSDLSS